MFTYLKYFFRKQDMLTNIDKREREREKEKNDSYLQSQLRRKKYLILL